MEDAFLELLRDPGVERVELTGAQVTVGRASENSVCFPDDNMVSRRHAVLTPVGDGWSLRDTGSVNGTFVNGERLAGDRVLQPGDRVTVGTSRFVYRRSTSTPAPIDRGPAPPDAQHRGSDDSIGSQITTATTWEYVVLVGLAILFLILLLVIYGMTFGL